MFVTFYNVGQLLSWMSYLLVQHPEIEQKIYDEIVSILGENASQMSDEDIVSKLDYETLSKFNYLESALLETLRLYPSVPHLVRFATRDIELDDGKVIKKGDVCIHCYLYK